MITVKIYSLIHPISKNVFYIGKTTGTLENRLNAHIKDKEANYAKIEMIKGIIEKGLLPTIAEIESHICHNEDEELAALKRETYWINWHKEAGYDICNGETKPRLLSNYQKSSNKSKMPIGIRFNTVQLEFLKQKEGILSNQKAVDFLLGKYYWENRLSHPDYIKGNQEEI